MSLTEQKGETPLKTVESADSSPPITTPRAAPHIPFDRFAVHDGDEAGLSPSPERQTLPQKHISPVPINWDSKSPLRIDRDPAVKRLSDVDKYATQSQTPKKLQMQTEEDEA